MVGGGYAQAILSVWDGPCARLVGPLCNGVCNTVQIGAIPATSQRPKPSTDRIAVKASNHLGDEVMKVFRV